MKRLTIKEIIKSYPKYFEGRFGCMDRKNSIYFEITVRRGNHIKYPIEVYYDDNNNDGKSFLFKNINEVLDYADKYFSHKKFRVGD